ncbi:hypothetical protein DY000_02051671 [Brassica cretica]|uniref:Dirigent protein n=1 Tax=Brassica cretica TaxID=69181 RepID=A0ABQ7F699_BRACR|nr:hypothetical protein DY000_02051671 [Brassica cretica]
MPRMMDNVFDTSVYNYGDVDDGLGSSRSMQLLQPGEGATGIVAGNSVFGAFFSMRATVEKAQPTT